MKIDNRYKTKDWRDLQMLGKYKGELLLLSKLLLLSLLMIFHMVSLYAQTPRKDSGVNGQVKYELSGRVVSASDGTPMHGVSIRIDKENLQIKSSSEGTFEMLLNNRKGNITFSYVGFKTQEINYTAGVSLVVKLIPEDNKLQEVEVVSTGYQKIPKERATGSFEFVDNKLFNRKVSTDFVSRLEDVVPGISSNKIFSNNRGSIININVRGLSTMGPDKWPLIVLDGVPYENKFADNGLGMFNNINPNDIESITVLKDAASLSIWGAQSANGVIVITTKRGKFNNKVSVSFNSNVTIKEKPDLYAIPQMSTSDYIDAQQYTFDKGRYPNSRFTRWNANLQPIFWLMYKKKTGAITDDQLTTELNKLRNIDIRDDLTKHVYRKAINQQYYVQLQSGGEKINSLLSVGLDKNKGELVTASYQRLNIKAVSQIKPIKNLLIDVGMSYMQSKSVDAQESPAYNRIANGVSNYPYMDLADEHGNPLAVDILPLNPIFRDTVAGGRLLNMDYYPLKELYASKYIQDLRETMLNISGTYSFDFGLKLNGLFAYQRTTNPIEIWNSQDLYSRRYRINSMATWNDESITWNYPIGDSKQIEHWDSANRQGRFTAEYNKKWGNLHDLSVLVGAETREVVRDMTYSFYLGIDPETGISQQVEFGKVIKQFNGMGTNSTITNKNVYEHFVNRYVSSFANMAYTFRERYIASASFRKDASNLYGVKSNDRGQPFWSAGLAWVLSNEFWMPHDPIDLLKFRATYGYNGNVNTSNTAYPIMSIQGVPDITTGESYAVIGNPPNPNLRWERVGVLNLGLDFAFWKSRFEGSVEHYQKRPKDLIAFAPIDPSTGYTALSVNSANLYTKGWDIRLNGKWLQRKNWEANSNLVLSYTRTKVTKAYVLDDAADIYLGTGNSQKMTPIEGMDMYSQLAYKWAGLDPETGEPRAYLNGEVTKDYIALMSAKVSDLENKGPLMPLYYGSFRNSIRFKNVEFSCNISFQLGHVFQRSTFLSNYFINFGEGHSDYAKRWQKPGDELITDVPSFTYPINTAASDIYEFSSALTEKAGQIKLRDLQISLHLPQLSKMKLKNLKIYGYMNNVGTIWRANKKGLDPEYGSQYPDPLTTSLGLSFNL